MRWIVGQILNWFFYRPVIWTLSPLFYFVPQLRQRLSFEKKNKVDPFSVSFKKSNFIADHCFEFSSEGEYQQVASLIEDALMMGKKIELVYFSPSVEKTVQELNLRFPDSLRSLRYPLLSTGFSDWVTSNELILVRYDLFPEFYLWSLKPGRTLKMIWVTLKRERLRGQSPSLLKKLFLRQSVKIIFASEKDLQKAQTFGFNGSTYDFRMEQIHRRLSKRELTLASKLPSFSTMMSFFTAVEMKKRIIFGNVWPEDIFLLKDLPKDFKCLIVPHKLDESILEQIKLELQKIGLRFHFFHEGEPIDTDKQVLVLVKKGILCELYADFSLAYVGGGFGDSVHSILEPLVAGCSSIACGPKNHRSTEFDIADTFQRVTVVQSSQEFSAWIVRDCGDSFFHDKLKSQFESYLTFRKDLLSC